MTDTSARNSDKVEKVDLDGTHKDEDSQRNTVNATYSDMKSSEAAHIFERL